MNKKSKELRFESIGGRKGVSERILEIAKEIVEVGSYKRAITGAGQMRLLAEISEADPYWDEKMSYGYSREDAIATGSGKCTFDANGSINWTEPPIATEPNIEQEQP